MVRKFILRFLLFLSPFLLCVGIEIFILPMDRFTFRVWEALVVRKFDLLLPGPFYPNMRVSKEEEGDLIEPQVTKGHAQTVIAYVPDGPFEELELVKIVALNRQKQLDLGTVPCSQQRCLNGPFKVEPQFAEELLLPFCVALELTDREIECGHNVGIKLGSDLNHVIR